MRIQFWHIIVLILVVLLLFGSSKLPDLARSVGKSMKIFKSEVQELRDDSTSSSASGSQPQPPGAGEQGRSPDPHAGSGGNAAAPGRDADRGEGGTDERPGDPAGPRDRIDPGRRER